MELYNFFSETVDSRNIEKMENINTAYADLIDGGFESTVVLQIVTIERLKSSAVTIIGQCYGNDTNIGDTNLHRVFTCANIKYYWMDSDLPKINNLDWEQ